jgi:cytochrome c556
VSGRFALALTIVLAACGSAHVSARQLPADVAAFVERRDSCDHFRDEEPYDAERAAELKAKLKETCTGSDKELADLRRKYARNRKIMYRLSNYENRVE